MPVFERFYREVEAIYPDRSRQTEIQRDPQARAQPFRRRPHHQHAKPACGKPRIQTLDDVRAHPERLAAFSPPVEAERKRSKDFLYENLYFSSVSGRRKRRRRARGRRTVRLLDGPSRSPAPQLPAKRSRRRRFPAPRHLRLHRRHDRQLHLRAIRKTLRNTLTEFVWATAAIGCPPGRALRFFFMRQRKSALMECSARSIPCARSSSV